MKTYWDFTRNERAALTEKQIEDLLDRELMSKGVLRVFPPELAELPIIDLKATGKTFVVEGLAFPTIEGAEAAIMAGGRKIDYQWEDTRRNYLSTKLPEIEVLMVYDKADLDNAKKAITKKTELQRANETATKEFDEASKAMNEVLNGVWSDWGECREEGEKHKRVRETFEKYKSLAEGNEETAIRFLKQAFPLEAIKDAWAWSSEELPDFTKQTAGA